MATGLQIEAGGRGAGSQSARITSIICPTRNRPGELDRCLASYFENCDRHGRRPGFVVVEGSTATDQQSGTLAALHGIQRRHGAALFYAGFPEKLRYAKRLMESKCAPTETIKFALFGTGASGWITTGANRNSTLLATVGEAVLSVDDDTICRAVRGPAQSREVAWVEHRRFSASHPYDVRIYAGRDALLESLEFEDVDCLGAHEALLGRTVEGGRSSTVVVTANGFAGDCGWGSPSNYLRLTGESLTRMIATDAEYQSACTSREILRSVDGAVLHDNPENFMSTMFGLDNRRLLPPFFPVFRGSDTVFGATLAAACRGACMAHLPLVLLHCPAQARRFWRGEIVRSAAGVTADVLISVLIRGWEGGLEGTAPRMQRLGDWLQETGGLPAGEFGGLARTLLAVEADAFVEHLEQELSARPGASAAWVGDVRRFIENLQGGRSSESCFIPVELSGACGGEAQHTLQSLVRGFGKLLEWWPDIVETARKLKASGLDLARAI